LTSSRLQKENVLSAATLVAKLSDPSFNGYLKYDKDDDGNLIGGYGVGVFAPGQRNSFDIVLHSNGFLYATDNGMNTFYGDVSVGCNAETDNLPEHTDDDKINLIRQGAFYGHPNRKRGMTDAKQCKWRGPNESSDNEYTTPLVTGKSSLDGIIEFASDHFGGQMRGNLVVAKFMEGLFRVVLSRDGSKAQTPLIPLVGYDSLDVTQAPDGTLIVISYSTMSLWYHRPKQAATTDLTIYSVFPRRGGQAGGNELNIYGENLNVNGTPKVTVDGRDCGVKFASEQKIICITPGGNGTVDVVVSLNQSTKSTYTAGYRYIKGVP
jgi:IPT/TIG domain/Glucose / Sorbosone dehydrogenase